jgi:hypothetical protein
MQIVTQRRKRYTHHARGERAISCGPHRLGFLNFFTTFILIIPIILLTNCVGAASPSKNPPPPPPPPSVTVSIQPTSASLSLDETEQFQATVTGTSNMSVTWEVDGVVGGSAVTGTISAIGLYTAPAVMPSSSSVTVAAVSQADSQASASAVVTLSDGIVVSVLPATAAVPSGGTQVYTATVSGAGGASTGVTWSVNGIPGGNSTVGTIATTGASNGTTTALYTAPAVPPSPSTVTVTATSTADSSKSGSASATISLSDNIVVSVLPATATIPAGGAQVYTASVSGAGGASTGVAWSINGIPGGNPTVGTIATSGAANGTTTSLYTAPAVPPTPATVTVTATSTADSSKSSSASATIICTATNSISPSTAQIALGQTKTFTASFCIASGTAITWDVDGIVGGSAATGTIASTGGSTALYTAPADLPTPNPVTIHATAPLPAAGSIEASASVTITSSVSVHVSPASANLALTQRASFTATVGNTPDTSVTWSVNNIPNGNASVGQVCVSGSSPCTPPAGPISGSIDYLAPAFAPAMNPVVLTATSHADVSRSGVALITIGAASGPVAVAVSPPYAFVPPSGATLSTQQFFASVTNTTNTGVTWSVQSGVTGQGCGGAACGSVDANGIYYAPTIAPSPNAVSVIATSLADATKFATATVALTSGPAIEKILPSSVLAGAVESFPFEVEGVGFVAGNGGPASVILLNGVARSTTCATAEGCFTSLNPSDVQTAGTFTIQVENPGPPVVLSNPVPFVVEPFDVSQGAISLNAGAPVAAAENIIVVEPTTAAASSPINVDFIGLLTGGNNCGIQGSPLTVTRPASGSVVTSICVHGTGLDPAFTYAFTGPGGGDIGVTASAVTGIFPNMIELDLQISSATLPGLRTLFITTPNNDGAVATGMLEVQ